MQLNLQKMTILVAFVLFPGTVLRLEDSGLYVRHYDGIESVIPREESYLITPEKFERDCQYILQCEESLVGQAVVARNEKDGMFHLGTQYCNLSYSERRAISP